MIADAAYVRTVGNLPDALSDTRIAPHLEAAELRLRRWVGDTAYDEAETEAEGLDLDGDGNRIISGANQKTRAFAVAEAYLALAAGLPAWNTVMERVGDSAAGVSRSGRIGSDQFAYLTPDMVAALQEIYTRQAETAVQAYLAGDLGGGSPGPEQSPAYDDDGEAI